MPTKEEIRHYIRERQTEKSPPPSSSQIRRRLGWNVITDRTPKAKTSK